MKSDMKTILGIVMILWLLGTMAVLISITGTDYEWLVPALFGQLWVVWGILFISDRIAAHGFRVKDSVFFCLL